MKFDCALTAQCYEDTAGERGGITAGVPAQARHEPRESARDNAAIVGAVAAEIKSPARRHLIGREHPLDAMVQRARRVTGFPLPMMGQRRAGHGEVPSVRGGRLA